MNQWLPEDIKNLRKKYGLSQKALAEKTGVTTNYIYLLEKGVKRASKTLRILLGFIEEKEKGKKKGG